jgi:hypothetical protein
VVDVNGDAGHGTGTVAATWAGDEVHIAVRPDAPRWFADRPLDETLQFTDQGAWLHAVRSPD